MEFNEVIKNRYSCKKYDTERQLTTAQLERILEAARLAPTAKNLQKQHSNAPKHSIPSIT